MNIIYIYIDREFEGVSTQQMGVGGWRVQVAGPALGWLLSFLAVQNSSIGLIVCLSLALLPLTIREFTTLQSDPRDL